MNVFYALVIFITPLVVISAIESREYHDKQQHKYELCIKQGNVYTDMDAELLERKCK